MKLKNLFIRIASGSDFMTLLKVGRVDVLTRRNKAYLGGFTPEGYDSYEVDYNWPFVIEKNCPVVVEFKSKISGNIWYVAVSIEEVINSHGDVCITVKKLGDVVTVYAAA